MYPQVVSLKIIISVAIVSGLVLAVVFGKLLDKRVIEKRKKYYSNKNNEPRVNNVMSLEEKFGRNKWECTNSAGRTYTAQDIKSLLRTKKFLHDVTFDKGKNRYLIHLYNQQTFVVKEKNA